MAVKYENRRYINLFSALFTSIRRYYVSLFVFALPGCFRTFRIRSNWIFANINISYWVRWKPLRFRNCLHFKFFYWKLKQTIASIIKHKNLNPAANILILLLFYQQIDFAGFCCSSAVWWDEKLMILNKQQREAWV